MSKLPTLRRRWDRSRRTVILASPPDASLTQQQFKDECDMNRIVKNAMRGIPPKHLNQRVPQYGDFSNIPDLSSAYDAIERAESAFSSLPAELRRELDNDPRNVTQLTEDQIKRYNLGPEVQFEPEVEPPVAGSEGGTPSKASKKAAKEPKAPPATPPANQED